VTNRGGRQRFLAKARNQIRIVADQVGKNDLDCVLGLQKDVAGLKNHAHPALAKPFLELITPIENWLAADRRCRRDAVLGTVSDVVGETITTSWALFH